MKNIQIEKPCAENYNKMTSVSEGKFCDSCQTIVVDFTKMSLEEIQLFFAKQNPSEKICGRYNVWHTTFENRFTNFINKIENAIYKTHFRKVAVWTISVLFFLLNAYKCMGKRMEPVDHHAQKRALQNDTIVKPK